MADMKGPQETWGMNGFLAALVESYCCVEQSEDIYSKTPRPLIGQLT